MKHTGKKLLSLLLVLAMILSTGITAMAAPNEELRSGPETLEGRDVIFYAYVDGSKKMIAHQKDVTAYWIGGRQCIDAQTLEGIYGELGFRASDLKEGSVLFLHADRQGTGNGSAWAEPAKAYNGVVYAATVNHKDVGAGGAAANEIDVYYQPRQSTKSNVSINTVQEQEVFYTVTANGEMVYVLTGDTIGDKLPAAPNAPEGQEFIGWFNGDEEVTEQTTVTGPMTLTAEFRSNTINLTAKLNGAEYSGAGLEAIVGESGLDASKIEEIELVSGKLTQADLTYLKNQLGSLDTFKLDRACQLIGQDGNPTTVLSPDTAVIEFKPGRWGARIIQSITLEGITEIQQNGLKEKNVQNLNLPDVTTVRDRALNSFGELLTLDIPNATVLGHSALAGCQKLNTLTMQKMEVMEKNCLKGTDALMELHIPATIQKIDNTGYGSRSKAQGAKITIDSLTPPTLADNPIPFNGLSSGSKLSQQATVTVPAGALEAYMKQGTPDADVSGYLTVEQTMYGDRAGNPYLREQGSYIIQFNTTDSWNTRYAYVKGGNALTEKQTPVDPSEETGKTFLGWSTVQNDADKLIRPGEFVPQADTELYAIFAESLTITFKNGEEIYKTVNVTKGEPIGSQLPDAPEAAEGQEFVGWFMGEEEVTDTTVFHNNETVLAKFQNAVINLTVKLNNGEPVGAATLEKAVQKAGLTDKEIQSLEFVSGKVTKADRDYIKDTLKWLKTVTLNVSDTMQLLDNNGQPTTILGQDTASFVFTAAPGHNPGSMETLTLGGITEVKENGIRSAAVRTVNLPDCAEVGASGLSGLTNVETVKLPKAKNIGSFAFYGDRQLRELVLSVAETLGQSSFKYTDELRKLHLPASVATIDCIGFGKTQNGTKTARIQLDAATPPTVKDHGGWKVPESFKGVGGDSTVTVPFESLQSYLDAAYEDNPNSYGEKAQADKYVAFRLSRWHDLNLRVQDGLTIEFTADNQSNLAYVKNGSKVEAAQIPAVEAPEGKQFAGWNTKKDGTGHWIDEKCTPSTALKQYEGTEDERPYYDYEKISVYPVYKDLVTITVKNGNETVDTIQVVKGEPIGDQLPEAPKAPADKAFANWADEQGAVVDADTVAEADMTIHPVWNDLVTIMYTDAGLFPADQAFEAQTYQVVKGSKTPAFVLPGQNPENVPTREGYVFIGWEPAVKETADTDMVYSANWAKDENHNGTPDAAEKKFRVTYTDGVENEVVFEDQTKQVLTGMPTPDFSFWTFGMQETTNKPVRKNYIFTGWTPERAKTVTEDAVYTAKWAPDFNHNGIGDTTEKYAVTFDPNGGRMTSEKVVLVPYGGKVQKPTDPTRFGCNFEGWYLNGKKFDFNTPITADLVLTAAWTNHYIPSDHNTPNLPSLNLKDHVAYIVGYEDGTVRPNGQITRAEAVTIFFRLMDETSRTRYWSTTNPFRDVNKDNWFNTAVSTMYQAGVIVDSKTTFRPNEPITRTELAVMAAQFTGKTVYRSCSFKDVDNKYWAADEIALVETMGWINGYEDGTFRPNNTITRAETVAIINRMTERAVRAGDMLRWMVTFSDNRPSAWYYEDIQEAANSHTFMRTNDFVPGENYCYEEWVKLESAPNWTAIEAMWASKH